MSMARRRCPASTGEGRNFWFWQGRTTAESRCGPPAARAARIPATIFAAPGGEPAGPGAPPRIASAQSSIRRQAAREGVAMRALRLVALSDDGGSLILTSDETDGGEERFELPIDERVRAAAR